MAILKRARQQATKLPAPKVAAQKPAPKAAAKPKPRNVPTVQAAPAPTYTPGQLTPSALQQLAASRVRYATMTGNDEYGNFQGVPGIIEQRRLSRVGDIGAQRVASDTSRKEGLIASDQNYAARGMGRSGLLAQARGKVEAAALDREGSFTRAEQQAKLDADAALAEENFNFASGNSQIRQAAEAEAFNDWMRNNPNPGAQPAAAPAVKPLPDWGSWVKSHPWAKTPAQRRILRTQYDAMVAKRAG